MLKLVFLRCRGCDACERQHAVMEQLREDASARAEFREIIIDEHRDAAEHYRAQTHPTLVLEKNGKEVGRWTGFTEKKALLDALAKHEEVSTRPVRVSGGTLPPAAVTPGTVAPPPDQLPPPGPEPFPEPPGPG